MASTRTVAAALLVPLAHAAVQSLALQLNAASPRGSLIATYVHAGGALPGAAAVPLLFTAVVTDAVNATRLSVFPYVNGAQWGAEAVVTAQVSASASGATVTGDFWLTLPPTLQNTSVCIAVAAHGIPQAPSVGIAPPQGAQISNCVDVTVGSVSAVRRPSTTGAGSAPRIGLYFEPWFTPLNFWWSGGVMTAEAIPSVGRYGSFTPAVQLMQAYWMLRAGVDVVGTDWTNNLWNTPSWDARAANIQELVNATSLIYGVWADAKHTQSWPVPTQVLLLGLDNGPTAPLSAIFEEMDFIRASYILNASVGADMYETYRGSPLIVIFDGTGTDHSSISYPNYTIRWMASQDQSSGFQKKGYWSWMDGAEQLPITYYNGAAEAATSAPAFFAGNGWTGAGAYGHNGGLTWLTEVNGLLAATVKLGSTTPNLTYLWTCQFNEYAGQPNGQGYGPNNNIYVDAYSADLTNDIEPTSPTACAYRRPGLACGGYGFRYMNLYAAIIDVMHDIRALDDSALIALTTPSIGAIVNYTDATNASVAVSWSVLSFNSGAAPFGLWMEQRALPVNVYLDGALVASAPAGTTSLTVQLPPQLQRAYPHRLSLVVQPSSSGATDNLTRYPLSLDFFDEDVPLATADMVPASVEAMIFLPEAAH